MKFLCNLTKSNYTIEKMNLLELRNRIVKQENLKELDILAGFDEASDMSFHSTENSFNILSDGSNPKRWKDVILDYYFNLDIKITTEYMNSKYNIKKEKYRINNELRELLYQNYNIEKDASLGMNIPHWAKFTRNIDISKEDATTIRNLKKQADILFSKDNELGVFLPNVNPPQEELNEIIHSLFNSTDYIIGELSFGELLGYTDITKILSKFNFRDFKKFINYFYKTNNSNESLQILGLDPNNDYYERVDLMDSKFFYNIYPKTTPAVFDFKEYVLLKKIPNDKLFEYIMKKITEISNNTRSLNKEFYYLQVEISPISINLTTEGHIELLDGYKRLLFINDPELLNTDAPVKVYTDLTDNQFFTLIHSANAWKKMGNTDYYHDRGFMFALRQRFDIKFENYFTSSENDISLLEILRFYDPVAKELPGYSSFSNEKSYSFKSINNYFVQDIKSCVDLGKIDTSFYKTPNSNLHSIIIAKMLSFLGRERVRLGNITQKEVSVPYLINQLYQNKQISKKISSKSGLSVKGRIDNFIEDTITPEIEKIVFNNIL